MEFKDLITHQFNQIIINEYTPGQGIGPHIDNQKAFGRTVATLSLLSDIQMDFKYRSDAFHIYLKRRSLTILEDDARYICTHGIVPRKSDCINGVRLSRGTRISITFREVI
jgi:alkylated DNA repair dioxygenase AlkB